MRTREIADRAAAEGITPLEYLIELLRKPYPENAAPDVLVAYDAMKLEAAKSAAPYMHPRLSAVDARIEIGALSGTLADQGRVVIEALSHGRLSPDEASKVMGAIATQARIIEVDELERRISALEARNEQAA